MKQSTLGWIFLIMWTQYTLSVLSLLNVGTLALSLRPLRTWVFSCWNTVLTVEYWSGFCNIYLVYNSKLQFFSLTNTGTIKANNLVTTILPGLQAGVTYDLLSISNYQKWVWCQVKRKILDYTNIFGYVCWCVYETSFRASLKGVAAAQTLTVGGCTNDIMSNIEEEPLYKRIHS